MYGWFISQLIVISNEFTIDGKNKTLLILTTKNTTG